MKQIQTTYIVNPQTKILIPARTIEYQTIACEPNRQLYIAQTPLEIIKHSCDKHWSSYEGRRTIVMKRMGFKQKVPIPISLKHNLLLFPTHSPRHHDAAWLAITHIKRVLQISTQPHQTRIFFKRGTYIDINVSLHTMKTQIARTAACFTHIQWQQNETLSPV